VVRLCPRCSSASTGAGTQEHPVDPNTVARLLCDADVVDGRGHRRSAIPPAVRRRVLARDGHRCATPGCGSTGSLEIHHRVPVSSGGSNDPSNLVTLCRSCHQSLHEIATRRRGAGVGIALFGIGDAKPDG
jgi:5-methylcytosine-specific restriction endonuclease McrA